MNIKFFHSLEGENIYFKAISMDDAQEIHKYASDKEVSRFIGWIPYDQSGKEFSPMGSVNGNRYIDSHEDIEYIRMLNKGDLELPFKQ